MLPVRWSATWALMLSVYSSLPILCEVCIFYCIVSVVFNMLVLDLFLSNLDNNMLN